MISGSSSDCYMNLQGPSASGSDCCSFSAHEDAMQVLEVLADNDNFRSMATEPLGFHDFKFQLRLLYEPAGSFSIWI